MIVLLWFIAGFLGWLVFTYLMRVGPYTVGDVFVSLVLSFTGLLMPAFLLLYGINEYLSKFPITKD